MKRPELGTIIAIMLALLPAIFFADLAWQYRLQAARVPRTEYIPVKTTTHTLGDGTTFDCKINNTTSMSNAMTCTSTDGNTEIDCSSDRLPTPFLTYFC